MTYNSVVKTGILTALVIITNFLLNDLLLSGKIEISKYFVKVKLSKIIIVLQFGDSSKL